MDLTLATVDPDVFAAIELEKERLQTGLELIASENVVSPAVMQALGSVLTNKYAEGYPGKRYYGGCKHVDVVETLAIERAKELFGADHVNVQPHSGAQANQAVYLAALKPGDRILGMELSHGGHLTHGAKFTASGKFYDSHFYPVEEATQRLDYDHVLAIAKEIQPKLIIAGASAYAQAIDFKIFREIADAVGAYLLVDMAHIAGLVAAGMHESPIPYADFVTTTTHKTLRGPRGGMILCKEAMAKKIDGAVFPGNQGGPLMHVIAAKAVMLKEALTPSFKAYQQQVVANAKVLASALQEFGFSLVSGSTENHLVLIDLRTKNITGRDAEDALARAEITVNKNMIPYDPEKPMISSGMRLGTPAVTSRGMKEPEMMQIAAIINDVVMAPDSDEVAEKSKAAISELCKKFPLTLEVL